MAAPDGGSEASGIPTSRTPAAASRRASCSRSSAPTASRCGPSNNGSFLSGATNFCWWYHEAGCVDGGTNPYDKLVYLDAANKPTTLQLDQQGAAARTSTSSTTRSFIRSTAWAGTPAPTRRRTRTATARRATTSRSRASSTTRSRTRRRRPSRRSTSPATTTSGRSSTGSSSSTSAASTAPSSASVTLDTNKATTLGLTDGGMYSIDLFQAERHTCASTYTLTLSGFTHTTTQCVTKCGDGIVAGTEVCDDGKNDGSYGGCLPGCTGLAPRCGDSHIDAAQRRAVRRRHRERRDGRQVQRHLQAPLR